MDYFADYYPQKITVFPIFTAYRKSGIQDPKVGPWTQDPLKGP